MRAVVALEDRVLGARVLARVAGVAVVSIVPPSARLAGVECSIVPEPNVRWVEVSVETVVAELARFTPKPALPGWECGWDDLGRPMDPPEVWGG